VNYFRHFDTGDTMCEKPCYRELEQQCEVLEQKFAERQQAEEAFLELEKRYRDLFDSINDLIMIHDLKGRLFNVNPAVCKLSGYTFEELIGRPISDFIVPDFRSLFQDEYLKEIKKQGHSEGVVIFQAKDGNEHYVEYRNILVKPEGRKPYVSGLGRDITDRVHAERALRESEKRYRTVFETTGSATVIIEDDETISLANSTFESLSGYSKKEIEGKKTWTEFVTEEDLAQMREFHRARRDKSGSAPKNYEFSFIDRQGSIKNIFVAIETIPDTRMSVASLLDITDRKRAEEALQKSYDELDLRVKERTTDLAKANEQLKVQIEERKKAEEEKEKLIIELKKALGEVKALGGLLPICASCKKIRDDKGYWNQLEDYIQKHSEAEFSHSVCPDCAKILYPELEFYD
jgi:PAS domain S-box-containing protein